MRRRGFLALLPALPAGFKAAVRVVVEAQVPVGPEVWGINAALTAMSVAYIQGNQSFIAEKVFANEAQRFSWGGQSICKREGGPSACRSKGG